MELLLLNTPDQHSYNDPSVERNGRRLAAWLDELPLINTAEVVPQLLQRLHDFNAQAMADKERLALLELYRQPLERLFSVFDLKRLRAQAGSEARSRELSEAVGQLFATLADGYKLVVKQGERARRSPLKENGQRLAIYRAIEQTALALLHAYRIYGATPPFAFLELHQLFGLAERWGCTEITVDTATAEDIGTLYKRILLLSISDPYHLGEGVVVPLFAEYRKLAPLCRIADPADTCCEGHFLLDLNGDAPPRPCHDDDAGTAERPRVFSITGVIKELERLIRSGHSQVAAPLLTRLVSQHRGVDQRSAVRRPADRRLGMVIGIDAICSIAIDSGDNEPDTWSVINENAQGYLLAHPALQTPPPPVGELLRLTDEGGTPQLAVVRWLRGGKGDRFEIGVEIVPGMAAPVVARGESGVAFNALLLPPMPALGRGETLIAARGVCPLQLPLMLADAERELHVSADEVIGRSECFEQFTLSINEPHGND